VIKLVVDRDEAPAWRLVSWTGLGADVLARATTGAEPATWQQAVGRLRDGDGILSVVRIVDGHYKWVLAEQCGTLIAESPPVYRDADASRRAFADARRAARTALGSNRNRT
jgi:hypothetical protein